MRVRVTNGGGGCNARGDRSCCGGVPARRGRVEHRDADRVMLEGGHDQAARSVVISAHKNPASSRATAAATTERMFLRVPS